MDDVSGDVIIHQVAHGVGGRRGRLGLAGGFALSGRVGALGFGIAQDLPLGDGSVGADGWPLAPPVSCAQRGLCSGKPNSCAWCWPLGAGPDNHQSPCAGQAATAWPRVRQKTFAYTLAVATA